MSVIIRALVAFVVFAAIYFFTFWVPFSLVPAARDIPLLASVVSLAAGLGAGWFVFRKSGSAPSGLLTSMMYGAAVVGAISFSAGFFGPIVFAPESNQGPLLGLLFTGPLGAVVGAVAGAVVWARRRNSSPAT